jgi:hypothetical protein
MEDALQGLTEYGSKFQVLSSATRVAANAKLMDLKTGDALWTGSASAATDDSGNAGGGLVGALIAAAVAQVVNHVVDRSYGVAGMASDRLLSAE